MPLSHNRSSRLQTLVERVESLEEAKAAISEDIKTVFAEAKSAGFDTKIMKAIIKERKLSASEREQIAALMDIYRAAVGMLDGTPLGEAARRRLERPAEPEPEPDDEGEGGGEGESAAAPEPAPPTFPPADLAAAREQGRQDAIDGKRVIDNPFTAGDPRRAAWDEGWCSEKGSDGMDIPAAWRRSKPRREEPQADDAKPEKGGHNGEGDA